MVELSCGRSARDNKSARDVRRIERAKGGARMTEGVRATPEAPYCSISDRQRGGRSARDKRSARDGRSDGGVNGGARKTVGRERPEATMIFCHGEAIR